jgi:hypothetical protein
MSIKIEYKKRSGHVCLTKCPFKEGIRVSSTGCQNCQNFINKDDNEVTCKGVDLTKKPELHKWVKNWRFQGDKLEAKLADVIAELAEENGMSANDVSHVFPYILRMLKSESEWTK